MEKMIGYLAVTSRTEDLPVPGHIDRTNFKWGKDGIRFEPTIRSCFDSYAWPTIDAGGEESDVLQYFRVLELSITGKVTMWYGAPYTDEAEIIRELPKSEIFDALNCGEGNTGASNAGHRNSGFENAGKRNTGSYNAGNFNAGYYNAGHCNTGNYNVGRYNSGNYNVGEYNTSFYCVGAFNTEERPIYLFNKPSDWTYEDWIDSDARSIIRSITLMPTAWTDFEDMTEKEKEYYPTAEAYDGYLHRNYENACKDFAVRKWKELPQKDKDIVLAIPNFDADIFLEITGIDVRKD